MIDLVIKSSFLSASINLFSDDHTRVILEEKNDKGTDYVNANYIDVRIFSILIVKTILS